MVGASANWIMTLSTTPPPAQDRTGDLADSLRNGDRRQMPPRRSTWVYLTGALIVSLFALPHLAGPLEDVSAFIIEASLIVLGLRLALDMSRRTLASQHLDGSARLTRAPSLGHWNRIWWVTSLILVAFSIGQLTRSKKPYPFMPFRMYGGAKEDRSTFLVFEAIHRSSTRQQLRLSQIVSSLGAARGIRGLTKRLSDLPATDAVIDPDRLTEDQQLGLEALRRLITLNNERRPTDPIEAVVIYRVDLEPPFRPDTQVRTSLGRVEWVAP